MEGMEERGERGEGKGRGRRGGGGRRRDSRPPLIIKRFEDIFVDAQRDDADGKNEQESGAIGVFSHCCR